MKTLLGILVAPLRLSFGGAGLVCVTFGPWALHFLVGRGHWQWGYEEDWYDGPLPSWGCGPLFLLCGMDTWGWCYLCDDYKCVDRTRHG